MRDEALLGLIGIGSSVGVPERWPTTRAGDVMVAPPSAADPRTRDELLPGRSSACGGTGSTDCRCCAAASCSGC